MTTARDIVTRALHLLGVLGVADTPSAEEAVQGLSALNSLCISLSLETALPPVVTSDSVAVTAGMQSFTIGVGGTINAGVPLKLLGAVVRDGGYDTPLRILSPAQYNAVASKTQSGKPAAIYPVLTAPLAVVTLWPVPDRAYTILLSSHKTMQQFVNLSDAVLLPDGYEQMLAANLAIHLAPSYGRSVPAELVEVAKQATSSLKRSRAATPILGCDTALLNRRPYNIYTDQ